MSLATFEFINPSDHIVFDAPDDECAALAALVVGEGRCGAKRESDGERVIGLALLDATDAKRFWEQNVTETRITITALGRAEALRLSAERARRMAIRGT